ncbi:MAG: AMP-binding protein, partial [bacterium]|nr:AMP-binding protein [bacterium]
MSDLATNAHPCTPEPALDPVPRNRPLPLSYPQQWIWRIDQPAPRSPLRPAPRSPLRPAPGSPLCNAPIVLHLRGSLDTAVLTRSLNELVRRHEILRTTFVRTGSPDTEAEPVQRIAPRLTLALPVVDLDRPDAPRRQAEARRLVAREVARPFDLAVGPLLRAVLLRHDAGEHELLLNMHDMITDDGSTGVVLRELRALYRAFAAGAPSPLPALPIQHADFAVRQRRWLRGERLEKRLQGLAERLGPGLPVPELPADRPRPAVPSFRGARYRFRLPATLTGTFHALGRRQSATPTMTALAAFCVQLGRYCGQDELVLASSAANRSRCEVEGLLGRFAGVVPVRIDLRGDPSLLELLAQVCRVTRLSFEDQDLPPDQVAAKLSPDRLAGHPAPFQVVFALEQPPQAEPWSEELTLSVREVDTGTSKRDLALLLRDGKDGLTGAFEFSCELFDASTVARMAAHFETLLSGLVADPERRLSALPMLGAAERHELLVEWNDTAASYPRDRCIHELFAAQVKRTPEAVAVAGDGELVSYGELDQRARRLAWRLREAGVGVAAGATEVRVGIFSRRSPEMVVGILAILKAGGAYLPIDPASPPERLAFILDDSEVPVLLAGRDLPQQAEELGARVVRLDEELPPAGDGDPPSGVGPENLAYVIYTSGSTGRPKASELAHRGLINLVTWHQRSYRITAADRATQLASPGFDAAVWELWPYLSAGAAIHIPPPETVADPARLASWLAAAGIRIGFLPTPLAEALLAEPRPELGLRALLTGGDRLRQPPRRDPGF